MALLLVFLPGAGIAVLTRNLTALAKWAIERSLPATRAEIGEVAFDLPDRLSVKKFVLRDRASGSQLLGLEAGSMVITFDDLRRRSLGEITLDNPVLRISPGLFQALPSGRGGGGLPPWAARKIVCDYAEVVCGGFGPKSPSATFKCSFSWDSPGADPAKPLGLTVWDVQVAAAENDAPFLVLDRVDLSASPEALLARHEIAEVSVSGGRLRLGDALIGLLSAPPVSTAPEHPAAAWKIAQLKIAGLGVRLDDTRATAADVSFQINTTLNDLSLSEAATSIGGQSQEVEISDIEILSPYDPLTKVLTLRSIQLRFTISGLLHNEVEGVTITGPQIFVGPDLFWYMDDAQKRMAGGEKKEGPTWKIGRLAVLGGRLIVGSSGRAQYGLPLDFRADVRDIELDNLAALKLQAAFEIPAQTTEFPSYQIEVSTREGDLHFAYPPEKNQNNLVGKVFFDKIRWRQFDTDEAWLSATFDRSGINGDFGGRLYGGYLSGGFSFLFDDDAPWIGWLYGKKVDLARLTDIIAPQNFRMTGPLNFKVQMDAFGKRIQRVKGSLDAPRPGRMTIGKLDDLIARIPPTWTNLKKSSTRIALETLRDFDYKRASGDFWFVENQGILGLVLRGPLGSRRFQAVLHADESNEGRWKRKP